MDGYFPAFRMPSTLARTRCGTWLHHFQCPCCAKWHTHGGGNGDEPGCYGTRGPHCSEVSIYDGWYCLFSLDKNYDFDIRPADEDVDWAAEYRAANAHVVAQVEAAELKAAEKAKLRKKLNKALDKALKTLP